MSAPSGTAIVEAIGHRDYSPSTLIAVAPGARIQLSGYEWGRRQVAILLAGIVAEKMPPCVTIDHHVSRHEACHVTIQFLLGAPIEGASAVAVDGHSLGRASSRLPPPGEQSETDQQQIDQIQRVMVLGDPACDLGEIQQFVTQLLFDYMPLVRRLADALVERKVLTARRCRQILWRAMKKDLRRARALGERDRREQERSRAAIQHAMGKAARPPLSDDAMSIRERRIINILAGSLVERVRPFWPREALHESAHAVISCVLGLCVLRISIVAQGSLGGFCVVGTTPDQQVPEIIPSTLLSDRQLAARHCMALATVTPPYGWRAAVKIYHDAREKAKRLIDENLPLIVRLASKLSQYRTLDRDQIVSILEGSVKGVETNSTPRKATA